MSRSQGRWTTLAILSSVAICAFFITISLVSSGPVGASTFENQSSKSARPPQQDQKVSSWRMIPNFAGKTLQWTQTTYTFTPDGPDPANGKAVTGEIWLEVGSDGVPTRTHGRYTYTDGSFYQEIEETASSLIVSFGAGYSQKECSSPGKPVNANNMFSLLPLFADVAKLQASGYTKTTQSLTHPLPATPSLAGKQFVQSFPSNVSSSHSWFVKQNLQGGFQQEHTLFVSSDGRVLGNTVRFYAAHGKLLQDTWMTFGPLQVYASTDVSVIDSATQQLEEKCHG
ncbi:MAG: hypothetical protein IMW89_05745 [Ktedonobacteraceae bacterium]|nr:hypothetical protein [Ktedonobacteraceae bacterium]